MIEARLAFIFEIPYADRICQPEILNRAITRTCLSSFEGIDSDSPESLISVMNPMTLNIIVYTRKVHTGNSDNAIFITGQQIPQANDKEIISKKPPKKDFLCVKFLSKSEFVIFLLESILLFIDCALYIGIFLRQGKPIVAKYQEKESLKGGPVVDSWT